MSDLQRESQAVHHGSINGFEYQFRPWGVFVLQWKVTPRPVTHSSRDDTGQSCLCHAAISSTYLLAKPWVPGDLTLRLLLGQISMYAATYFDLIIVGIEPSCDCWSICLLPPLSTSTVLETEAYCGVWWTKSLREHRKTRTLTCQENTLFISSPEKELHQEPNQQNQSYTGNMRLSDAEL